MATNDTGAYKGAKLKGADLEKWERVIKLRSERDHKDYTDSELIRVLLQDEEAMLTGERNEILDAVKQAVEAIVPSLVIGMQKEIKENTEQVRVLQEMQNKFMIAYNQTPLAFAKDSYKVFKENPDNLETELKEYKTLDEFRVHYENEMSKDMVVDRSMINLAENIVQHPELIEEAQNKKAEEEDEDFYNQNK